jgi:hypothetical protein
MPRGESETLELGLARTGTLIVILPVDYCFTGLKQKASIKIKTARMQISTAGGFGFVRRIAATPDHIVQ